MASRYFVVTYNNPTEDSRELLEKIHTDLKADYTIGQLEKGEKEGTIHLQFAMYFKSKARLTKFRGMPVHATPGNRDNGIFDYCEKSRTRMEGPWEFGVKPLRVNNKMDIKERNQKLLEIGPIEAVNQGLIRLEKFKQVKQSMDLFELSIQKP